jgi:uncharacterized repeat protein (TIGR03803 family)
MTGIVRIGRSVFLATCFSVLGLVAAHAQCTRCCFPPACPSSTPPPAPSTLYSFAGQGDGVFPLAGLIQDANGNLYGTTQQGGTANQGTVFKLDKNGQETVLHNFSGADGSLPMVPLIQDASGNLYGTTLAGGTNDSGTVFKVDASGQHTVLHNFNQGGFDGFFPSSPLVQDAAGNLYGTTASGGASDGGTVFKLDASGNETVLHSFTGVTDAANPVGNLVRDAAGNLYGTSYGPPFGAVYKMDPGGNTALLYSFKGPPNDGALPQAGLIRDSTGNLYGTTLAGGNGPCGPDPAKPIGCGTVFKLDSNGQETVLFNFQEGVRGLTANPSGLLQDTAGVLYGMTGLGGTSGAGTIFAIASTGNETVLHSFTGTNGDGAFPQASLIFDSSGDLLGTTQEGGAFGQGTVFKQILPDFSLAPASASLTAAFGGNVSDVMTIASQKAPFADPIHLSCSVTGPAPPATCALNPTSVTPGSNVTSSTLTITSPTASARLVLSSGYFAGRGYALWLPLALLGMTIAVGPRKVRRPCCLLCGILLPLLVLAACGGGNSNKGPVNYTVTVTAAAPLVQHTTQVTVTVQ